jgi:two-component system sensor histidine kinase TctE
VFSPFYRAASSMQTNPGGSGLGLAIVRDIAALHHATVSIDSGAGGRGLLVRVSFPAA